jgi:NAD(P)-dependent dehydrogenase (short-subunit alcohol dehydrogenase family)
MTSSQAVTNVTPSFRLDGAVAVVTGAGSGLGQGAALALAEAGASLVLVGRTQATLDATRATIADQGGEATTLVCDVTDASQVKEKIEALPRIDVLVNNAGTNIPEDFLDVSEEHLDLILDLNVRAAFLVAQAVARRMAATGGGSIVNMSSQMGHVGSARRSVYCMSKHALEGLTKALAVELAPRGIRVNSVAPTFAETPMTRPFFEDRTFRDAVLSQIPIGRLAKAEDVTGAIVFLASPAAAMITGTSLLVDGGWTAR